VTSGNRYHLAPTANKELEWVCGCASTIGSRSARRRFKKLVERTGMKRELRAREYYEKTRGAARRPSPRRGEHTAIRLASAPSSSSLGVHMNTRTAPATPQVERNGKVTTVTFTAGALRDVQNVIGRELDGLAVGADEVHLMLDFTHVTYLNSVELGTLITLHKRARSAGGRVTLFNMNAQLREVLSITRLDTLFALRPENDRGADPRTAE
jgi:anti-anti-sigma factor